MKWRPIITVGLICAAVAGVVIWVIHARMVGHWLQIHTGTVNEPGPYYGFWSGFGSDLTEFAIIGTIATAAYQLFKKYNCHYPGCWRVGNHQAAGGQFSLCYRHHPDYQGKKPTFELIQRLHKEHLERQAATLSNFHEAHQHVTDNPAAANGGSGPGAPAAQAARSGDTQSNPGTPDGTAIPPNT
jgi:hypothetical protein